MSSCAIFGHSEYSYTYMYEKIERCITRLITQYKVTEFYIGLRGNFDSVCLSILCKLKRIYPFIRCIRVWAYMPNEESEEIEGIDETIYLLERFVPPLYAIVETNKVLVQKVEYVLSGVSHEWGGAWGAVRYAQKRGKKVLNIFEK